MGDKTSIEWTDATWNPITGCSRVSEGCRNCYAEIMAARFSKPGQWGEGLAEIVTRPDGVKDHRWTGKLRLNDRALDQPLRWRKPRRIFVNSTSDLFHESVPDEWIDCVFAVMALAPQHTFQVLTKRPERARAYMTSGFGGKFNTYVSDAGHILTHWLSEHDTQDAADRTDFGRPLPNVWLGTSIEDQATAEARIPHLLATPAAVRCRPRTRPGPSMIGAVRATIE
jgi:protein gp37